MVYNLFISHSWDYPEAYEDLTSLLDNEPRFLYRNYSVPKDDPLNIKGPRYESELKDKIKAQMQPCSVVLVLAGVYSSYSDSIQKEIKVANELEKPIIAIEPWGSERTSSFVKDNATAIVKWNGSSIVNAIRNCAK